KGGTLPERGLYAGMLGAVSWSDKLVGPDKNSIDGPNLTQYVFGPMIQYVSKFQLFGAHYSAAAMFPFANTRIEYPRLDADDSTSPAISQLWGSPLTLGWHTETPPFLAAGR